MSLLAALQTSQEVATEKDTVGGGFSPLESGMYAGTVALAYLQESSGGALGLVLSLKTEEGREVRQTLWMTSGKEKGKKNYYEKEGQKFYLPGFTLANNLCLLTVGKEISDLETEKKVIKQYSKEANGEVPTQVDMLTDLIGKEIIAAIFKQTEDKTAKNEATGQYVPTGETRDVNEIDKFFRARDKMTAVEIRAQATEPTFYNEWDEKWSGVTRNRVKSGGNQGTVGAPKAAANVKVGSKPTASLFA